MSKSSPIEPYLKKHGALILDGGLASELEKLGFNLNSHLWSAELLESSPDALRNVHLSYLEAGADCIISASYQASIAGFVSKGYSKKKAKMLLESSITLANQACDEFMELPKNREIERLRPLVAASIGPYGAYLANGSEYHGDYNIPISQLKDFHESRWDILSDSFIDLFAIETIPSIKEAEVLLELIQQTPNIFAWISFSCQDYERISDGTLIKECSALFKDCAQVVAVGINCTAPKFISALVEQVSLGAPKKPVVVYPNSGNIYDIEKRSWTGNANLVNFGTIACDWYRRGAKLIGGCCQTGPEHIKAMRNSLLNQGFYQV